MARRGLNTRCRSREGSHRRGQDNKHREQGVKSGENRIVDRYERGDTAVCWKRCCGTAVKLNGGAGNGHRTGRTRLPLKLAVIVLSIAASSISLTFSGAAEGERAVALSRFKRSAMVGIAVGKTLDVRVDEPFTDVTVGDPEVADVSPLTDHSLSI